MVCNRSKKRTQPLANKSLHKDPSGLSQPASQHPFIPMPPYSEEDHVSALHKRGPLGKAFKNGERKIVYEGTLHLWQ